MSKKADKSFKDDLSWEDKARQNPLFAVMSADQFAEKSADPGDWTDEDLRMFFEKGRRLWEIFLQPVIQRIPLQPGQAFIVEYGSGMGRVLKHVKTAGFECAGIDISQTMLNHSRRLVPEVSQLSLLDENGHCDFPTGVADFVYSYAVLQHIPQLSRVQTAIAEMCRILKPDGLLKVQFLTFDSPFKRLRVGDSCIVHNAERESYVIQWHESSSNSPTRNSSVLLPELVIREHTNWVGVPLSYSTLERFLHENNVRVTGFEEDVGHKRMAWVLARKEG